MVSRIINNRNRIFLFCLINKCTLTGTSTPGQSGLRRNSNEKVLHVPQNSRTGASPSDGLVSYPGHLLGLRVSYPSAEMQSAYSTATAE